MQLPPDDEIVMIAGSPPIRATKARYFEDVRFTERVLQPPDPTTEQRVSLADGWSELEPRKPDAVLLAEVDKAEQDRANAGLRREPELPQHVEIVHDTTEPTPEREFALVEDNAEDRLRQAQNQALRRQMRGVARQVSMNPDEGMDL
jgi:type IV secretion system protein VirD4